MSLPVTALLYDQLKFKNNETTVENSGNKVRTATVMIDGEKRTCFFKKISENYPEFLAKNCVGVSVMMRMAIGERAAEERLVYSEDGKEIVGTLSIGIPEFKPLKFITFSEIAKYLAELIGLSKKDTKSSYDERFVKPGVDTLLRENIIELVVAQWAKHQDDFHPGNVSVAGGGAIIDWDMSPYDFIWPVKGNRLVDGVSKPYPDKTMGLKSCDLDVFPIRDSNASPTHWPTHKVPGNYYATKAFACLEAFRALAGNPVLDLESGGRIEYQEQLFTALLKELLTYDKETLRARLKEYLGDTPLDFKKLEQSKQDNLLKTTHGKTLFTDDTDQKPYADYMTEVGHLLYQELYRAVVFYPGIAKNEAGVPVVGFKDFVHNKPSAYRKVMDWIKGQNKKMGEAWGRKKNTKTEEGTASSWDDYFKKKEQGVAVKPPPVVSGYTMPEEARYDLNKVMHRFNGVWRDAHLPVITDLMKESADNIYNLAECLGVPLNRPTSSFEKINDITTASEFFGDNKINLPNATNEGLKSLMAFHNSLAEKIERYMKLDLKNLTVTENQSLRQHIFQTIIASRNKISEDLGPQTEWAKAFLRLVPKLERFCSAFDIECREAADDQALHNPVDQVYAKSLQEAHSKPEILSKCLNELFKWANEQEEKGGLQGMIVPIISMYTPASWALLADRQRGPGVEEYLKQSKESGANKLARILSVGGTEETSLNTLIIKTLVPLMVISTGNQGEGHILSLKNAIELGGFDVQAYTTAAATYAKSNDDFTHLYSRNFAIRFNTAMYQWINTLDRTVFESIKNEAWNKYAWKWKWTMFSPNRDKKEIDKLFAMKNLKNDDILASIFGKVGSGYKDNSFNTILFDMLRIKMVSSVASHHANDGNLTPILGINNDNKRHFIDTLYDMTSIVLKKKSEHPDAMAMTC